MSISKWALTVALAAGLSETATAGVGFSVGVAGRGGSFGFSYNQPWGGYRHYHPGYYVGGYYAAPRYYAPRVVYAEPVVVAPTYVVQPAPTYVVPAQPHYQVAPAPTQYPQYPYQPQYQPTPAPEYPSAPINVPATPAGRVPPPPPQPSGYIN